MAELTTPGQIDENTENTETRYLGRVKWFNLKTGYGFINPLRTIKKDFNGHSIFVHHTSITVGTNQYKYLTEGEYVEFSLGVPESSHFKYNALDVTGVSKGFLLCETKFAALEASKRRRPDSRRQDDNELSPTTPRAPPDEEFQYPTQKRTVSSAEEFQYPTQKRTVSRAALKRRG